MLSLEVRITNRTNHWTNVTNDFLNITSRNHSSVRKYWRTLQGVENYIVKAMKTYPWLTRENFRINGTEEERRKPHRRRHGSAYWRHIRQLLGLQHDPRGLLPSDQGQQDR